MEERKPYRKGSNSHRPEHFSPFGSSFYVPTKKRITLSKSIRPLEKLSCPKKHVGLKKPPGAPSDHLLMKSKKNGEEVQVANGVFPLERMPNLGHAEEWRIIWLQSTKATSESRTLILSPGTNQNSLSNWHAAINCSLPHDRSYQHKPYDFLSLLDPSLRGDALFWSPTSPNKCPDLKPARYHLDFWKGWPKRSDYTVTSAVPAICFSSHGRHHHVALVNQTNRH